MPNGVLVYVYIWLGGMALFLVAGLTIAIRTARIKPLPTISPKRPKYDPKEAKVAAEALCEAIGFRLVSGSDALQRDTAALLSLRQALRNRYPLCHEVLELEQVNGFSLLYRWPSPQPQADPMMLCAHMDTAPAAGEWDHPPFEGMIEDGYVWGRGAMDGKSVMICIFEAMESLLKKNLTPSRDVYFSLGHDKETGGGGAKQIAQLLASKSVRFSLVVDEGYPISDAVLPVGCPVCEIGAAEKGNMSIRLSAAGESGDTAYPPAHTALGVLSEALGRVEFWPPRARITPLVKDMLLELAPWLPYKTRMQIANIWLFRRSLLKKLRQTPRASALVCSTTAAAMSSCGSSPGMLPGLAEAILNVRLLTGENERMLTGWLDVLFAEKDLPLKTEVLSSVEPSRISDYHSREFDEMKSAVRDVFGDLPVIPALLCSQSDARFYEPLCPCVFRFSPFVAAPEDKQAAHGENEKIAIPSLGTGIQFYRRLVERMALSEDN